MPSDHRKGDAGHEGRRRLACALALLALLGALALCWKSQALFKRPESAEAELGNVEIAADEPAPKCSFMRWRIMVVLPVPRGPLMQINRSRQSISPIR